MRLQCIYHLVTGVICRLVSSGCKMRFNSNTDVIILIIRCVWFISIFITVLTGLIWRTATAQGLLTDSRWLWRHPAHQHDTTLHITATNTYRLSSPFSTWYHQQCIVDTQRHLLNIISTPSQRPINHNRVTQSHSSEALWNYQHYSQSAFAPRL